MSLGAAWNEGYVTALNDFGIRVTNEDIETRISRNPHTDLIARRTLTDYECHEIRNALGYHFEDCPGDWDTQTEIVTTIVRRILARRPDRTA